MNSYSDEQQQAGDAMRGIEQALESGETPREIDAEDLQLATMLRESVDADLPAPNPDLRKQLTGVAQTSPAQLREEFGNGSRRWNVVLLAACLLLMLGGYWFGNQVSSNATLLSQNNTAFEQITTDLEGAGVGGTGNGSDAALTPPRQSSNSRSQLRSAATRYRQSLASENEQGENSTAGPETRPPERATGVSNGPGIDGVEAYSFRFKRQAGRSGPGGADGNPASGSAVTQPAFEYFAGDGQAKTGIGGMGGHGALEGLGDNSGGAAQFGQREGRDSGGQMGGIVVEADGILYGSVVRGVKGQRRKTSDLVRPLSEKPVSESGNAPSETSLGFAGEGEAAGGFLFGSRLDPDRPGINTRQEQYEQLPENEFQPTRGYDALSTFSVDVDTASYSNLRRYIQQGQMPPPAAIRIEEMLNYFSYHDPGPHDEKPFAVNLEVADCPWQPGHRLLRIALTGKQIELASSRNRELRDKIRLTEQMNRQVTRELAEVNSKFGASHANAKALADQQRMLQQRMESLEATIAEDQAEGFQRPASNLVLLIDVSGSMNQPNKLPLLKQGFKELVRQLGEEDRVTIVTYAGRAGIALEPTSGDQQQRILDAIESLVPGGSTHGSAGIELAYRLAQQHFLADGVNKVLLATDGDLNVGITQDDALVHLIEQKSAEGVFLTVLGFGTGNLKDAKMEKLADHGNGMYAYIDSAREAHKVLVEQLAGSLFTIAKDVKLQLEFNPAQVASYRLIGYENRALKTKDFADDTKDAGEIGAGHSVTALYEIVPASSGSTGENLPALKYQPVEALKYQAEGDLPDATVSEDLLTLSLRYKEPDENRSQLLEFATSDSGSSFAEASSDFRFAAGVAAFGMQLRRSQYDGQTTLASVEEIVRESLGDDPGGYRSELLDLIRRCRSLSGR